MTSTMPMTIVPVSYDDACRYCQRYARACGRHDSPALGKIVRHAGIAGQLSYSVAVTYPGEATSVIRFEGSTYGGPVVMVTPAMTRGVFVSDPSRFGEFGPAWVRAFFGDAR